MSTTIQLLISAAAGFAVAFITKISDRLVEEIDNTKKVKSVMSVLFRSLIFFVALAILFISLSSEESWLSMAPTKIMATYNKRSGLSMIGYFSGKGDKSIYLLAKQLKDNAAPALDVWTVSQKVINVNKAQTTWRSGLPLPTTEGEVKVGDMYEVFGIMTNKSLAVPGQVSVASLARMNATQTEVLNITIKEVTDE